MNQELENCVVNLTLRNFEAAATDLKRFMEDTKCDEQGYANLFQSMISFVLPCLCYFTIPRSFLVHKIIDTVNNETRYTLMDHCE